MSAVLDPPRIRSWSFSRLDVFEKCAYRTKLAYLDKIPEPARPLKPGTTEQPNDRGTRIHEAGELFVKGGVELIDELKTFAEEFERLRLWYAKVAK